LAIQAMSLRMPGPHGRRFALAIAVGVLAAAIGGLGPAAMFDDAFHRASIRMQHRQRPPAPIVVLGIDAADPWPWPNGRIAELLARLRAAGVRGAALDLPIRANAADPEDDARLARALLDDSVVLGVALAPQAEGPPRALLPPIDFADAARLGHVLLPRDRDGRIRLHVPHATTADGIRWPSLALALVQHGGLGGSGLWDAPGRWLIAYDGGPAQAPTLRASDLLAGRIGSAELHGRWILVGLADPARQAPIPGPHGNAALYPVEHEARALAALLQGTAVRPLPGIAQSLLAFALSAAAAFAGLAGTGRDWRMPLACVAGIALALALSYWLLGRQHWFAPGGVAVVLAVAVLVWAALMLRQRLRTRQRLPGLASRRRLVSALQAIRNAGTPHALLLLEVDAIGSAKGGGGEAARLAQLLRTRARRPGDLAAQLGSGRFALLLPGTTAPAAERILDEIRLVAGDGGTGAPHGRVQACGDRGCDCLRRLSSRATAPAAGQPAR